MKCLSVRQPWAAWIVLGAKDVENRSWATKYRGPLLIHAGQTPENVMFDPQRDLAPERYESVKRATLAIEPDDYRAALKVIDVAFTRGAIIGLVDLVCVGTRTNTCWADQGVWQWTIANPGYFAEPIPYKGRLGLFEVPDEVVRDVMVTRIEVRYGEEGT